MLEKIENKWYDNKGILIILFFLLPPLGIYGVLKHKTESWKKVLYILPLAIISFIILLSIIIALNIDNYKTGLDYYKKKEYVDAYNNFRLVSIDDKNYNDAIKKINEIKPYVDSINKIKEKQKLDEKKKIESNEISDLKIQLKREINSVKKSDYVFAKGNTVSELQLDLVLLGAYWKIVNDGLNSNDDETINLAKDLKSYVVKIQVKAFPKLRNKYTEIAKKLLWEHDVDVYSSDGGKVLNLTSGIFASNGNIKSTEEMIEENLKLLRFRQIRYRWYDGDDEFTYYNLNPLTDYDPVTFDK